MNGTPACRIKHQHDGGGGGGGDGGGDGGDGGDADAINKSLVRRVTGTQAKDQHTRTIVCMGGGYQ